LKKDGPGHRDSSLQPPRRWTLGYRPPGQPIARPANEVARAIFSILALAITVTVVVLTAALLIFGPMIAAVLRSF
jgi:hypothetical protein